MGAWVAYTIVILSVVTSMSAIVYGIGKMGSRKLTGLNDPETAKRYFLLLLGQAREEMLLYDDGDSVADSIYADQEVLSAIKRKLDEHATFTMRCLFNCPVPEAFQEAMHGEDRVDARTTGLGEDAPRDTHLKVIDKGRLAYLTRHGYGSMVRPYELVDCLNVASWALKGAVREELGGHMETFEKRFATAA